MILKFGKPRSLGWGVLSFLGRYLWRDEVISLMVWGLMSRLGTPLAAPMSLGRDPEAYPQPNDLGDRSIDLSPGGQHLRPQHRKPLERGGVINIFLKDYFHVYVILHEYINNPRHDLPKPPSINYSIIL